MYVGYKARIIMYTERYREMIALRDRILKKAEELHGHEFGLGGFESESDMLVWLAVHSAKEKKDLCGEILRQREELWNRNPPYVWTYTPGDKSEQAEVIRASAAMTDRLNVVVPRSVDISKPLAMTNMSGDVKMAIPGFTMPVNARVEAIDVKPQNVSNLYTITVSVPDESPEKLRCVFQTAANYIMRATNVTIPRTGDFVPGVEYEPVIGNDLRDEGYVVLSPREAVKALNTLPPLTVKAANVWDDVRRNVLQSVVDGVAKDMGLAAEQTPQVVIEPTEGDDMMRFFKGQ